MEHITVLSRLRRNFFAAVSHDLKAPFIILKGQIESMILSIGKYKDIGKVLPETLKEVENIERLVKESLTISKIEMDGLAGKTEPVSPSDTLTKVTETLFPLAQEQQITVHSQLGEDVTVSGNAFLLEKAIHNILSNAIRHSLEWAEFCIRLTPSALAVTNTGTSIPGEICLFCSHLFTEWKNPGTNLSAVAVWGCIWSRLFLNCMGFSIGRKITKRVWCLL